MPYSMNVTLIGDNRPHRGESKSKKTLESELISMKLNATEDVRSILNIIGNWAFGATSHSDCLIALDRLLRRWGRNSAEHRLTPHEQPSEIAHHANR
jgi:hypothetical protein